MRSAKPLEENLTHKMEDIILVTADSVRYDFVEKMDFIGSKDVVQGKTAAHYTRPSLASLLSSSYIAAGQSRVITPSLPEVLSDNGYTCIGFGCSPQLDEEFGFGDGFDEYTKYGSKGNRGNPIRERLSQVDILRRLYHRFYPPHAKIDHLPTDEEVLSEAVKSFNDAESPRFLWVHLIDTHRPYGRGENRISKDLDKKAVLSETQLEPDSHQKIIDSYIRSLQETDKKIQSFVEEVDSEDSIFVFTSDHGDEFGEEGYYFHQPQRRRVSESLITVPVAVEGLDTDSMMMNLVDIAPTITGEIGVDTPPSWNGYDLRREKRDHSITIAPWNNKATVKLDTGKLEIVFDGNKPVFKEMGSEIKGKTEDIPEDMKRNLRDLGYIE